MIADSVADPAIPSLAAVLDPIELQRMLDALGRALAGAAPAIGIHVLRHHPGKRCVFEVARDAAASSQAWIGKVYATDRADVYRAMVALRAASGPESEFSVPEPIAYVPEQRFLLQEKVTGLVATEYFLSGDDRARERIAERCAHWLARLHAVAPLPGPTFDRGGHRLSMDRWAQRIEAIDDALAERARALRASLERAAADMSDVAMRTCHGSFTHYHVIAANGRTVSFDFDDYILADPGSDVARFIISLRRLALREMGSMRSLDLAAGVFLQAYRARSRPEDTSNTAFHAAAICLRLAKKDVKRQADGWREKALATLDEGQRVLEQGI